ncbi:hypothetical protein PAPHI01_0763 [Pancytospora philotis]|nr:hypothetical protein PAPHI01_0763 [Pancytospora philotis]
MEAQQRENDEGQNERRKLAEGMGAVAEQMQAAKKAAEGKIRYFRWENVEIKTLTGAPLWTRMWVSDEDPVTVVAKAPEVFKCDVCAKEFDKKQKLLLHARFHKI